MATFCFTNRSVAYNSETDIANITNSTSGPLFNFGQVYTTSPSGCPYFLLRFYKNGIEINPLATPSVSQDTNIISQLINILLEPGSTLRLTCVNLDPMQQTHSMEGAIE